MGGRSITSLAQVFAPSISCSFIELGISPLIVGELAEIELRGSSLREIKSGVALVSGKEGEKRRDYPTQHGLSQGCLAVGKTFLAGK